MKRKLVIAFMLWIAFLLQTAVFPKLGFMAATPNILLIMTVSIGFMQGGAEGILTGFFAGLFIDLFYGDIYGYYALIYLAAGWYSGRYSKIYFDEDIKIPLFLTTVCDLAYGVIIYLTRFLLRGRFQFWRYLTGVMLPELISTLVLMLILYRLIYGINHTMVEKEKKGKQSLWIRD